MTDLFAPPTWQGAGYYPDLRLPAWFSGPDELLALLRELAATRYKEIDHRQGATARVESAFARVVATLEGAPDGHRRLVMMGLVLAMACRQPLRLYAADDPRPEAVRQAVLRWIREGELPDGPAGEALFPPIATRHQGRDEAIEVHRLLSCMPGQPDDAGRLLLEILDLTLDGYAIRPPGTDDRDLLHWWLSQVVPAAWHLRLPDHIFTGDWPWPPAST